MDHIFKLGVPIHTPEDEAKKLVWKSAEKNIEKIVTKPSEAKYEIVRNKELSDAEQYVIVVHLTTEVTV